MGFSQKQIWVFLKNVTGNTACVAIETRDFLSVLSFGDLIRGGEVEDFVETTELKIQNGSYHLSIFTSQFYGNNYC